MATDTARHTSVKLDQDTRARIKRLATAQRRTAHWVMREAIHQYLEREEKREAFKQDTLRAWEEYQQTGLHLSGAEFDLWLAKLEAGEDSELPECHN